jgi:hypothetical protein
LQGQGHEAIYDGVASSHGGASARGHRRTAHGGRERHDLPPPAFMFACKPTSTVVWGSASAGAQMGAQQRTIGQSRS